MLRIKRLHISDIWIGICMFIVVFSPPIINTNLLHAVAAFSWVYILFHFDAVRYFIPHGFSIKLVIILSFFAVYIASSALVHFNPLVDVTVDFIYWIFEIIPFCIFVTTWYQKQRRSLDDLMNLMIVVGIVQAVLAILAFVIPSLQEFFIQRLIDYGYEVSLRELSAYRMYGFALSLTSYSAFYLAVMACAALYYYIATGRISYIIKMGLLIFAAVINARTGAIIFLAGAVVIFFYRREKKKDHFAWKLLFLVLLALCVPFAVSLISKGNEETLQWLTSGYEDIEQLFRGSKGGTTSTFYYYSRFWKFPTNILTFLFGNGCQMMGSTARIKYQFTTDVGFVNDLWKWGVFGALALYFAFFWLILFKCRSNAANSPVEKYLRGMLLVSFLVINLKGYFFVNQGTVTLVLIYAFYHQSLEKCRERRIAELTA